MNLPDIHEIEALHRKHAPSEEVFKEIWQHCEIVSRIAEACIETRDLRGIDKDLVRVGCMLHDIGVYRLYDTNGVMDEDNYIRHGVLGYELLKQEGYDDILCRFASHHTGVGLTAEEIKASNLPLPAVDMLADTEEERLVMYADKFHSKLPSHFNTIETYKKHIQRFGDHKVKMFEGMIIEFGEPDVKGLAALYGQEYH
jgi:uncharacterized protein